MQRMAVVLVAAGLALVSAAAAQNRNPIVELKGKVERIQLSPGEGMPFVAIQNAGRTAKVYLGSIRYLVDQGFNPKVGDEIAAKAYKLPQDYVAITVTLPAANKTVRLRDDTGRPVWRGRARR